MTLLSQWKTRSTQEAGAGAGAATAAGAGHALGAGAQGATGAGPLAFEQVPSTNRS